MQTDLNPAAHSRLRTQSSQRSSLRGAALGMVSTESFPAIIGTADAMLKAADVCLVGYEKTGSGQCTAIVRGGVANVRMAVEAGIETAQQFSQYVSSSVIPRPLPNLDVVLPICARLDDWQQVGHRGRMANQAIGLLETRGFPAMVGAADAMTKSAEVTLVAHETIGSGLCTIIIRGSLPNVAIAIDAGMHEAERIGELHAVMVIPRPLDDLEQVLPKVKQMVHDTPLRLPLNLEEKAKELVALETAQVEVTQAQSPLPEAEQPPLHLQRQQAPERQPESLDPDESA